MELNSKHMAILQALEDRRLNAVARGLVREDGYLPKPWFSQSLEGEINQLLDLGLIEFTQTFRFTGAYLITYGGRCELFMITTSDEAKTRVSNIAFEDEE